MNEAALTHYLKPLQPWLADPKVNEIMLNQPHTVWVERQGTMVQHIVSELSFQYLTSLSRLLAHYNQQSLTQQQPRLSGSLPSGERVQVVIPPATESNQIAISIRKQATEQMPLEMLLTGATENTQFHCPVQLPRNTSCPLSQAFIAKDLVQFILSCIESKRTILIAGGTSSGKTTFLDACIQALPNSERILILEDTQELSLPTDNSVRLLSCPENIESTMYENLKATLRMRPDRIIMGELRGSEAAVFLEAVATGHPGSLTTVHANSAKLATDRLCQLYQRKYPSQSMTQILELLQQIIDVTVHLHRRSDGKRVVSEVIWQGR